MFRLMQLCKFILLTAQTFKFRVTLRRNADAVKLAPGREAHRIRTRQFRAEPLFDLYGTESRRCGCCCRRIQMCAAVITGIRHIRQIERKDRFCAAASRKRVFPLRRCRFRLRFRLNIRHIDRGIQVNGCPVSIRDIKTVVFRFIRSRCGVFLCSRFLCMHNRHHRFSGGFRICGEILYRGQQRIAVIRRILIMCLMRQFRRIWCGKQHIVRIIVFTVLCSLSLCLTVRRNSSQSCGSCCLRYVVVLCLLIRFLIVVVLVLIVIFTVVVILIVITVTGVIGDEGNRGKDRCTGFFGDGDPRPAGQQHQTYRPQTEQRECRAEGIKPRHQRRAE